MTTFSLTRSSQYLEPESLTYNTTSSSSTTGPQATPQKGSHHHHTSTPPSKHAMTSGSSFSSSSSNSYSSSYGNGNGTTTPSRVSMDSSHSHSQRQARGSMDSPRQRGSSVEVMRCSRCAKCVETIARTSSDGLSRVTTDDALDNGMVRWGHNLYYCDRCARLVGYK